jgi:hypothetical protein
LISSKLTLIALFCAGFLTPQIATSVLAGPVSVSLGGSVSGTLGDVPFESANFSFTLLHTTNQWQHNGAHPGIYSLEAMAEFVNFGELGQIGHTQPLSVWLDRDQGLAGLATPSGLQMAFYSDAFRYWDRLHSVAPQIDSAMVLASNSIVLTTAHGDIRFDAGAIDVAYFRVDIVPEPHIGALVLVAGWLVMLRHRRVSITAIRSLDC